MNKWMVIPSRSVVSMSCLIRVTTSTASRTSSRQKQPRKSRQAERERNLVGEKSRLTTFSMCWRNRRKFELPIIVKGDVFGSIETLKGQLGKIGSEEVKVTIKHSAVGGINDSDVTLAEATGAIIASFNVTASGKVRKQAEAKGVDIPYYDVIYELIDDANEPLKVCLIRS